MKPSEKDMSITTTTETEMITCDLHDGPHRSTAHCVHVRPVPQPELDAGEWRLGASDKRCVFNATGNLVASTNSARDAAQIVSDHRSAAAVPKLVAALENAKRCLERSDRSQLSVRKAIEKANEALTTVNQTGGER